MRTAAFTIIAPNYRAAARVLMDSLRAHHPEWDRFVVLVGGSGTNDAEPFTTIALDTLQLPNARRFCFRYTLLELSTSVKPWAFAHLFGQGYDRVLYFDPDVRVYSPLDELDDSFITLTPHLTAPVTTGVLSSERSVLLAGIYNLGFLAVTRHPELETFLQWWQAKLELHCVVQTAHGLFVDQKWMDFVPGIFSGVRILRHAGYNAGWWNLFQRDLAAQPLRFFHFSGFDPRTPNRVTRHRSAHTVPVTEEVRPLFDDYAAALRNAGFDEHRQAPYAFAAFADGTLIHDAARFAYRNSDELQEAAGDDPFAHPELFEEHRDKRRLRAKAAVLAYRVLAPARPLMRFLPQRVQKSLRNFLLRQQQRTSLN